MLHHRLLMGHTSSRCMIRDDTTVSIESSLGHDEVSTAPPNASLWLASGWLEEYTPPYQATDPSVVWSFAGLVQTFTPNP